MPKIRRLPVPIGGVPCPECGSRLTKKQDGKAFFYSCACGVTSYRVFDEKKLKRDFPTFYGIPKKAGM